MVPDLPRSRYDVDRTTRRTTGTVCKWLAARVHGHAVATAGGDDARLLSQQPESAPCARVSLASTRGRWVMAATVLGSGVAFLDSSIVNVALPRIGSSLGGGVSALQWVLDAYLLTLGALLLVGGVLGDMYGRRRMFVYGLVGFGIASLGCGLAPTTGALIAARAVQGVAGALLVPGSLAIIVSTYLPEDRPRAIGMWSGLAGVSSALGPFLGGYLVDAASWRWAFFLSVPLVAAALAVTVRHVPETRLPRSECRRLDVTGAVMAVVALTLVVLPLIEAHRLPVGAIVILGAAAAVATVAFLVIESRSSDPMLPLSLFRLRTFSVANAVTFAVYGGMSAAMFLVSVELQREMGYSAFEAGAAFVPFTVLLLVLSPRIGALLPRFGARLPLTAGPLLSAIGLVLFVRVEPGATYLASVLPGVVVFSLGMCLVVAPVTTTALMSVDEERSGLASGVNNAVARVAGLLAIAVVPIAARLPQTTGAKFTAGFHRSMLVAGAMLAIGAIWAFVGLHTDDQRLPDG